MTVSAAIDHPSLDARFVNGERTIGVSDPVDAAAVATYRIARFLELPHGVYSLKWLSTVPATLRIGPNEAGLTVHLTSPAGVLVDTQVYLQGGMLRYDIDLVTPGSVDCGVMFLIYSTDAIVYASNADGWKFDTTRASDASLTESDDPRLALPVLSVLPNWENGITERIEYLTTQSISETGAVQTRTLRDAPRRSFELRFLRKGVNRARLDAFLVGVGRGDHLLPLWHEQFRPVGGVGNGSAYAQFPTGTLALREYRAGDLVIVTNGDPDDYDLLEVASVNTSLDRLVWQQAPSRKWDEGCRIAPLRIAHLTDKPSISNHTASVGTTALRCTLVERDAGFAAGWGECSRVWRFKVNRADPITMDYDRIAYTVDNQTGIPYTVDPGGRAIVGMRVQSVFRGRGEAVALRRFIAASSGRAKRFWMPSLTQDVVPTAALGGDEITAQPSGLAEYVKTQQSTRAVIGVVLADGSGTLYREVVSVAQLGTGTPPYRPTAEVLTLNADLPVIALADIDRIQFMMPSRFDQDAFELEHMVSDSAVVRSSFVIRSSDLEGMPDIDCAGVDPRYATSSIAGIDEVAGGYEWQNAYACTTLTIQGLPSEVAGGYEWQNAYACTTLTIDGLPSEVAGGYEWQNDCLAKNLAPTPPDPVFPFVSVGSTQPYRAVHMGPCVTTDNTLAPWPIVYFDNCVMQEGM